MTNRKKPAGLRERPEQQCGVKLSGAEMRCPEVGEPHEGFNFFVCDFHLNELGQILEELWRKKHEQS